MTDVFEKSEKYADKFFGPYEHSNEEWVNVKVAFRAGALWALDEACKRVRKKRQLYPRATAEFVKACREIRGGRK